MNEYCYINQLPESIKNDENVFKIGKTSQPGDARLNQYPKGTIQKIKVCVSDCTTCERELINKFDILFRHRPDKGREYYEGAYDDIEKVFIKITSRFLIDDKNIKIVKKSTKPSKSTSFCEVCDFYTDQKRYMSRHIKTFKHIENLGDKSNDIIIKIVHKCDDCKKYFSSKKKLKCHQHQTIFL